MIVSKEDYRFVSQDSLKRITIRGKPYPVRNQKLVTIGEDKAFVMEAIAERNYLLGASDKSYDEVILREDRELESRFGGADQRFFDEEKIESVKNVGEKIGEWHYEEKYDQSKGGLLPEYTKKRTEAREKYKEKEKSVNNRTAEIVKNLDEEINGIEKEGKVIKEGIKHRREKEVKELEEEYARILTEEEEDYKERLSILLEEHERDMKELEEGRESALKEISEKISAERDPNAKAALKIEYQKTDVSFKMELEEESSEYYENVVSIENDYEKTKRTTKEECDRRVSAVESKYDKEIEKVTEKAEKEIKELQKSLDETRLELANVGLTGYFDYKLLPKFKEYQESVEKSKITDSCTDEFMKRPLLYDMSSTVMNRHFADMERRKIYSTGSVNRRPYYYLYDVNGVKRASFLSEWDAFSEEAGADVIEMEDLTTKAEISSTDFGLYVGRRKNHDTIESVTADFIMCCNSSATTDEQIHNYPRGTWSPKTYYQETTVVHFKGEIPIDIGGKMEAEANLRIGAGTTTKEYPGIYKTWWGPGTTAGIQWYYQEDDKGTYKTWTNKEGSSYRIVRVELTRAKVNGTYVEAMDSANDDYDKERKEITDEFDKKIEKERNRSKETIERLEEEYEEALESIEKEKKASIRDAKEKFVQSASEGSDAINGNIKNAKDDKERNAILQEWRKSVYMPSYMKYSDETVAAYKKAQQEEKIARDEFESRKDEENERYKASIEPIKEARQKQLEILYKKYWGDTSESGKHINGIYDDIREEYEEKVKDIKKKTKEKIDEVIEEAEKEEKDALSQFKSSNPYDGGEYDFDTPLTEEQESYILLEIGEFPEEEELKERYRQYRSAYLTYQTKLGDINRKKNNKKVDLNIELFDALLQFTRESQDARLLFTGRVDAVQDYSVQGGIKSCTAFPINGFVKTEPRTLTGCDFTEYYEELKKKDEEEE